MNPEQELIKAYLLLRTAYSAVTHFKLEVVAIDTHNGGTSRPSSSGGKAEFVWEKYLDKEERHLELWQERLLQGQIGVVEWAAIRAMGGKRLPSELSGMIRDLLKPC